MVAACGFEWRLSGFVPVPCGGRGLRLSVQSRGWLRLAYACGLRLSFQFRLVVAAVYACGFPFSPVWWLWLAYACGLRLAAFLSVPFGGCGLCLRLSVQSREVVAAYACGLRLSFQFGVVVAAYACGFPPWLRLSGVRCSFLSLAAFNVPFLSLPRTSY